VLVTYTMPLRVRTGWGFAVLFTGAIGLHFLLVDRSLEEHHPRRFPRVGRWVLVAGLLAGWLGSVLIPADHILAVALMTAFVGGAVLLTTFTEELPPERGSSFPWFVVGVGAYAGLLVAVTAAA
jgi:low temperature requirement protein LtrA